MSNRRTAALVALLLPAGLALTSCGFDYATDRVNTLGSGVTDRSASVDLLGKRIVASADGEGRLIGTLVNNSNEDTATLESVTSPDGAVTGVVSEPVEIAPASGVNLAEDVDIPMTGDYSAGEFVSLVFTFSTGEEVSLDVPVVKHCFQYDDIEISTPSDVPHSDGEDHADEEEPAEEDEEESTDSHGEDPNYICEHTLESGEGEQH